MNFQVGLFTVGIGIALGALLTAFGLRLEGGAIAVLSFGPLYIYLDRKYVPGLLLGPSILVFTYHAFGYALGPLSQRYILQSEFFIDEGMVLAQWGAVIGLTTYLIVFPKVFRSACRWASSGKPQRSMMTCGGKKLRGYTLLLLMVSFGILLFGYMTGGYRRMGGIVTDLPLSIVTILYTFWSVQSIVFFFLGFLAAKRRGVWLVLWIVVFFAYAGLFTLEGSRGAVITAVVMSVMGAGWAGVSARKLILALCLCALMLVPLAGIVDTYRSFTKYASQYDEGFLARASAFWEAAQENIFHGEGQKNRYEAVTHSVSAITVDRVMALTPGTIPYAGLENLSAAFYGFIPKVIWPDRPVIDDADLIAFRYGVGPGDNTSHVYIPAVGEGYRRFGWVGIPLIYALSGIVFGFWIGVSWAKRDRREWMAMLIVFVLFAPGVWSSTFNSLIYSAIFVPLKYFVYLSLFRILQDGLASFGVLRHTPGIGLRKHRITGLA